MSDQDRPASREPSPTSAGRVDEVCDRFEAVWKAGGRPRIEDHLGDVPDSDRRILFGELLALDLAYRRQGGEDPEFEEYQARFPSLAGLVTAAFAVQPAPLRPHPDPASATGGERDLLFGLLALHNAVIDQSQLAAAFHAWTRDKSRSLADYLVDHGALDADGREVVESLVALHLKKHGGDPGRSLDAIPAARSTRERLMQVGDDGGNATLTHFGSAATEPDAPSVTCAVGPAIYNGLRFRILRPHRRGGLGEVSVAVDTELNREVALKQILEQFADDSGSRARFLLEAEVTGGLEHPGIVPVYGLGTYSNGRPYYAMRFVRGDSLGEVIAAFHAADRAGRDPGARSLALSKLLRRFLDVCNAIDYAHSRGVLHRDLKPANVIVGNHGETLVVDWGFAKATGRSDPSAGERTLRPGSAGGSPETRPGSALGTPAFMSPEQATAEQDRLGPASDVYGLGAMLYCLLTGRAPFDGNDVDAVLDRVRRGDFSPPRSVDSAIHPALEAVCLKAMSLRPEDRYGSPRALAEDLERWLADEPVSAWKEPLRVQACRWVTRHRSLVTSAAAALIVTLAAAGYLAYEAGIRRALAVARRLAEARGRVEALATAEVRAVPGILKGLGEDRRLVRDQLEELARSDDAATPAGRRRELHARLALLPDDPKQVEDLAGRLRQAETQPDEVIVIRDQLREARSVEAVAPALWTELAKPDASIDARQRQVRAAAALAAWAPSDPRWKALGPRIAALLIEQNPLLIGAWREAFQPVAPSLAPALRRHFGDRSEPGRERRALAYSLLYAFATDPGVEGPSRTANLAALILDADLTQFANVLERLRANSSRAVSLLTDKLKEPARFNEALTRGQGQVATALMLLGEAGRVWPLLKHTDDPGLRSELIHDLAQFGADPRALVTRLQAERDVSARRALILALGEFRADQIPEGERQALTARFLAWYRIDPDPGVHGAVGWLLRQKWGQAAELERIDKELAGPRLPRDRDWYVNGQGQTFTVVRGPVEFLMGSPEDEAGRTATETRHRRKIDRSFAIGTQEVTVAQYIRFLEDNPNAMNLPKREEVKISIPGPDCPMLSVDWYDAARYCNWLNRQEGIPEAQWCYPAEIKPGMSLPSDYLSRTGYRLPTEAEWEYACRAGSLTCRPYGSRVGLLGHYAWYAANSGIDRPTTTSHPVGQKKPNDLGLFDILGNAFEWIHDPYDRYPTEAEGKVILDAELRTHVPESIMRVLRGGAFLYLATDLRCAARGRDRPTDRDVAGGLRPARTFPRVRRLPSATQRPTSEDRTAK